MERRVLGKECETHNVPAPTQSSRPTALTRPTNESARLDDEGNERDVWAQVETDRHRKIVSTDADRGAWAIGDRIR